MENSQNELELCIDNEMVIDISVLFKTEEEWMEIWLNELTASPKLMVDWRAYKKQPKLEEFSAEYWNRAFTKGTIECISRQVAFPNNLYYPGCNFCQTYEHEDSSMEDEWPYPECKTFDMECGYCTCSKRCFYWSTLVYTVDEIEQVMIGMLIEVESKEGGYSGAGHACAL
jgi:hypothetical protein